MIPTEHHGTPAWLRALGRKSPPETLPLGDRTFALEKVYKHDFFAATAKYVAPCGEAVVLKVQREASLFFLPMTWLGRLLAGHEHRNLAALDDLALVPRALGRYGRTGLVHEYVPGRSLCPDADVDARFFDQLRSGLRELHGRGRAYVDLEKLANVIVGEDGRPYLCDFQIVWNWPARLGGELWPLRRVRAWLQTADLYHVDKLKRRVRPDLMSSDELAASRRRPRAVHWFGVLTRPLRKLRRRLLRWLDPTEVSGERGLIVPVQRRGNQAPRRRIAPSSVAASSAARPRERERARSAS